MVCGMSLMPRVARAACDAPFTLMDVTVSSSVPSPRVSPAFDGEIFVISSATGEPAGITTRPLLSSTSLLTEPSTAGPAEYGREEISSRIVTSTVVPLAAVRLDDSRSGREACAADPVPPAEGCAAPDEGCAVPAGVASFAAPLLQPARLSASSPIEMHLVLMHNRRSRRSAATLADRTSPIDVPCSGGNPTA